MKTVWIIVGILAVAGAGVGIYFYVKKVQADKEAANLKAAGYVPSGINVANLTNAEQIAAVENLGTTSGETSVARTKKVRSKETYTDSKGNVWMKSSASV